MKILVDNGHGKETPGKRSPVWKNKSQLYEWEYTREIAHEVVRQLKAAGVDAELLTPEYTDVPLYERIIRANKLAQVYGQKNTFVVSIHNNASKDGKARGWEIHTSPGQTISDTYATVFWNKAKAVLENKNLNKMRHDFTDKDPDFENDFAILTKTICPAVLTENLFMDNEADCAFLLTKEGKTAITKIHVEAILEIIALC